MYNDVPTPPQAAYDQAQTPGLRGANLGECAQTSEYRPSPAEEAEKRTHYHYEEAEKASRAAHFLRENPAFSEFINLIRRKTRSEKPRNITLASAWSGREFETTN